MLTAKHCFNNYRCKLKPFIMINTQITNSAYIDGLSDGVLGKEKCYHKIGNKLHTNNEK